MHASAPALHPAVFEDGLGKRHHADAPNGELLEVLELREDFATDGFAAAVRERVAALDGFETSWFAHFRTAQRIDQQNATLFVVYDRVPGVRLSAVLDARRQSGPPEVNAALYLVRQIVAAIALLHERLPGVGHGAIALERVIVTPDARVVVADHVLGLALEQLRYPPMRYWKELRIALPVTHAGLFDQRVDVMQIGTLALELVLGRRIEPAEYPRRLEELTERAWRTLTAGADDLLPAELRVWLLRMLQLAEQPYESAVDAWADLEIVLGACGNGASFVALQALMAELTAGPSFGTPPPAPLPPAPQPVAVTPPPREPESPSVVEPEPLPSPVREPEPQQLAVAPPMPEPQLLAVAPPTPEPHPQRLTVSQAAGDLESLPPAVDLTAELDREIEPAPLFASAPVSAAPLAPPPTPDTWAALATTPVAHAPTEDDVTSTPTPPPSHRRWLAAAAVLVLVVTAGLFGRQYLLPPASAEAPGTLIVTTNPPGFQVFIDGQPRGTTPLTLELAPGAHELKIATEGEPRIIPFVVTAGGTVAQAIEIPRAAPLTGQLMVQSEPAGAQVTIDDIPRGTTPITVEGLAPGARRVTVQNDLSTISQEVSIEAGVRASLVVPMTAPQGVPVSGWISIAAPAEVQVYEDGRLLGTSRSDRIMVSAGLHTLEIVNEPLGYRATRAVTVAPGRVSPVRLDWPTGTMALNAQPWAEVWVNGKPVGETPIGSFAVPVGTHEVVFRHPQLGEQTVRATVTASAPARVSVDLRRR